MTWWQRFGARWREGGERWAGPGDGSSDRVSDLVVGLDAGHNAGHDVSLGAGLGLDGLVLVTREGCHLCVQAETLLRALAARRGEELHRVDVDADLDADTAARYTDLVPVVEVDGREVSRWHVDVGRVEAALDTR